MSVPISVCDALIPELDHLRTQYRHIRDETAVLTLGLSNRQFNWSPEPGCWSIGQCLGHLWIAGEFQRKKIAAAIETARARGLTGTPPFHYGFLQNWILRVTNSNRKLPSPRRYRPLPDQPPTAIVPTFLHLQNQFVELIEKSNGLDLRRVKVTTPIAGYRLSLGAVFAQVAAHEQRHLDQARRVREHPNFPDSSGGG